MTDLTNSTADSKANVMKNVKQIFTLPRWLKICLSMLSVIAVAGLIATFALMKWADGKIESAQLGSVYIDRHNTGLFNAAELENKKAYDARVYFERLDVLLRSKVIAYIDIVSISWDSQIDTDAIGAVKSQNRHLKFTTSQDLYNLNLQNLGTMEYKMDFSPLLWTIGKYFIIIFLCVCGYVLCGLFFRELFLVPRHIVSTLKHTSLPQALYQGYKSIDPLYRHTFWIVFIALNIVFGFYTIHFLWGDHDWGAVFDKHNIFAEAIIGRYSANIIHLSLQNSMILPLLNNIIGFAGFALAVVWLCMYLNIQKKLYMWVIIGLLLTLQPFTFARMYFIHQVSGLFIAIAIGILGFVLAKKAGEVKNVKGGGAYAYILCLLAVVCIHWGIASYQPFLDTTLILLCGGIIVIIIDERGDLKHSFYKSRFLIIAVIFAALSYKIVFDLLKKLGSIGEFYSNQMIAFSDLPERILLAIKSSFCNLINFDMAFMPLSMTILFAVFLVIFIVLLFVSSLRLSSKFSIIILFCGAIVATQTHNIISQTLSNYDGIHYYGLLFLRVLFVALAFKLCAQFIRSQILVSNLLFILSAVLIWVCVVQDLYAQRVQKLAFDYELKVLNRVIDRLEQDEHFSYEKQYCGVMFGEVPNIREKLYHKQINPFSRTINKSIVPGWYPKDLSNLMLKDIFAECDIRNIDYTLKEDPQNKDKLLPLLKRLDKAGILDTLEPWPSKNSVVVFEYIIVFVASKGNLDEIRQMVKTLP